MLSKRVQLRNSPPPNEVKLVPMPILVKLLH